MFYFWQKPPTRSENVPGMPSLIYHLLSGSYAWSTTGDVTVIRMWSWPSEAHDPGWQPPKWVWIALVGTGHHLRGTWACTGERNHTARKVFPFGFFYNFMIIFRCKSPCGIISLLTPPQYLLISLLKREQIACLRPEPTTGYRVSLGLNNPARFSLCLSSICGKCG